MRTGAPFFAFGGGPERCFGCLRGVILGSRPGGEQKKRPPGCRTPNWFCPRSAFPEKEGRFHPALLAPFMFGDD